MRTALILLSLTYILSQFFRAFLAVLTPVLGEDLGATAVDLSQASGAWFLVFAAMQIPVGWALDTIGPKRTAAVLVAIGAGGGSFLFSIATAPWHITVAMGLIGVGCSPVLMASFYLIARTFPPAIFATYSGLVIAVGNLGNIGASLPMALLVEAIGWRASMGVLGAVSIMAAILIYWLTPDPAKVEGTAKGSVLDLFKIPALWLIFPLMFVNYAPAAGIRGLWAGPYLEASFGSTASQIGLATMVMGLAMVLGSAIWGPIERILKTRKWLVLSAAVGGAVFTFALALFGAQSFWMTVGFLAVIGIAGTAFPLIVAHARAYYPPHLMGRGMTLINLFGIGGVGVMQMVSGKIFESSQATGATLNTSFATVFGTFGAFVLIGLAVYAFSKDRLD